MERGRPIYRLLYLAFALAILQAVGFIGFELYRVYTLHRAAEALAAENQALWERVRALEAEVAAWRTPAALEAEARRLGLVKRDETLYPRTTH